MDKKGEGRKTIASSRSPGRPKQTNRASSKSPGRSKSTVRSKSKSPGRAKGSIKKPSPDKRPKSPAPAKRPKSPAPAKRPKSPAPVKRKASPARKPSPGRSPARKVSTENNLNKATDSRASPFVRLERSSITPRKTSPVELIKDEAAEIQRERSISLPKASTSSHVTHLYSEESTFLRRSTRTKRDEVLDKIKNVMDTEVDKILKANNVPLPPQYERKYGNKPVREFGSWPGALASIFLLPIAALLLQMSCTKNKCAGVSPPASNWRVYLDLHAAGYYMGFVLWQVVLNALPLGRKASFGYIRIKLSGFYNALLTGAGLAALYYHGYNVTAVLVKSVALLSSAVLTALVLSLVLFIKGGRTKTGRNLNADGNKLYDFFIGREIQPTIGPVNIKALFTRMEFVGILLLDAFYLLKYIETHAAGVYSPTLLFVVIAHTIYVADTLWFEDKFMTSFQAQYEGVGYMNVMAAAVWPFLITLTTRYIVNTGYEAPTYLLVICGIFYFLGYFVYRASNSQKAEFRKKPNHPVFSKYETISTVHGKRLLCGGWWGLIRHPNYLGDIVMVWAVAAVVGLSHWLPYVFPGLHAAILVHRTFRVATRCKTLYGLAWDRYTQIVKYRLVPRVF